MLSLSVFLGRRGSRRSGLRGSLGHSFLRGRSALPFLVAAIVELLVGRLFLHAPIMSQIGRGRAPFADR